MFFCAIGHRAEKLIRQRFHHESDFGFVASGLGFGSSVGLVTSNAKQNESGKSDSQKNILTKVCWKAAISHKAFGKRFVRTIVFWIFRVNEKLGFIK
jgi:hypothetical protein